MPEIHVETDIAAAATDIWAVLTDFESYAEWNPVFVEAHGQAGPDARIRMRVEPTSGPDRDWLMRMTEYDPPRRLEWVGTLFAPFVFRGRHAFELQPLEDDRTRLVDHEDLTGIVSRVLDMGSFHADYEAVGEALKERVESGPRVFSTA